jgi:methylmalonyl-CoA/ethylmalonyl-CoA epimerase
MILRIDHISLAVKDFEKAKQFFETLFGAIPGAAARDEKMKYFWNIFSLGDLSRLELMKATGAGSFLDHFLSTRKDGGVHHITLETDDIEKMKAHLENHNVPYFGFLNVSNEWQELFIHPKDAFGVLIQIAQMRDPNDYLPTVVKPDPEKPWSVRKTDRGAVLSMAHPGGGKVDVELGHRDLTALLEELQNIIA